MNPLKFITLLKNSRFLFQVCFAFILISIFTGDYSYAQQIDIDRIEKMPNHPAPYQMRNWRQVALGYDSLVFNTEISGQFLPLIRIRSNTVNYPEHESVYFHSYVGTHDTNNVEAINFLPAVIGGTLVGIDKSNQNGYNWVLMCEEFFNNRPSENVYLNNPVAESGRDWWYDTMPNVFFYQLYDLYPGTGDFTRQFRLVADRWLEAVIKMGGSLAPWTIPNMNYRAWSLSTMSPLTVGVKEPEAAGAIAWLLYHAFIETGEEKYRIGAEWAMEFLNSLDINPSYELQLPYGVYVAARMNAELGTQYDIEKLVNWCFDAKDNVRNWGATLGNWGGYDCYGLIGEAKYTGYGFAMNGFEMAGALVPMVRYDERFARAIGKWMLNLANASRLYYSNFLPDDHQDGEVWAHQYDSNSYIAHEALRQYALHTGISPFATGDAAENGWAETNFALYGSSHVGILGGIIDTTSVNKILKLDLRKTDFFQDNGFPSYLYFNPYNEEQTVEIDVGWGIFNLYDAVSNNFLLTNASGLTEFQIPGNSAVILVLLPADGIVTYELDRMLVNGIVADYHSGQPVSNFPPRIKAFSASDTIVVAGSNVTFYCTAEDRDNDQLQYTLISDTDTLTQSSPTFNWTAPDSIGTILFRCIVDDQHNGSDTSSFQIRVVDFINHNPVILKMIGAPRRVQPGDSTILSCSAMDPDNDSLSFSWSADAGNLREKDSSAVWTAPMTEGFYYIRCLVRDEHDGQALDSLGIVVLDSLNIKTGIPLAFYPFNGNANDESGNDHHGIVLGAILTEDRFGDSKSAYQFNGSYSLIQIPNSDDLNFQDAITVSLWMKVDQFFQRESYPISHGSWKNRWKISITDQKKIRWTVYTNIGIKDLDSQLVLEEDIYYNVTTIYDGSHLKIYIDGTLDNSISHSGRIKTTAIDLTIGQELPYSDYNFKGILDDIRIYNYSLTEQEIQNIFNEKTLVEQPGEKAIPHSFGLDQNFPNPFNNRTTIPFQMSKPDRVSFTIFDILGRQVCTLINGNISAGYHSILWDGRDDTGTPVSSGIYICQMKSTDFCQKKKLVLIK